MNADKAPSAASFDQRLTLMTIFAADLLGNLQTRPDAADYTAVPIDIGVTTAPYYSDKSAAINSSPEGKHWYPSSPQHIHLLGFDTLTRFFAPKYYQSFSPPLSALTPYFDAGHGLRATLRPDDAYGSEAEQRAFMQKLADGEMEADGGKKEWAAKVELVDPTPQAGVSSTVIRKAAKAGEWDVVGELCTEGVAEWVREEGLYEDDDRGAKMA
jgi:nicotinamide-nucleotide adenylyltransferase